MRRTKEEQDKLLAQINRIEGQVRGIGKMVAEDRYCIDIMQQNLAVIGLLKSAHQLLLEGHLNSCFRQALDTSSPGKKQKMIDEILTVTKLTNK